MAKKWFSSAFLLILIGTLLSACNDYTAVHSRLSQAAAKQTEMTNYSFEGSATLQMGDVKIEASEPLTLGLFNLLKNSTIEWKGVSQDQPAQLETKIKVIPGSGMGAIEIPVILKDNKLYFYIPAINKPDEYMMIDMNAMAQGGAANQEGLQLAAKALSGLINDLISDANPKWFKESKNDVSLPDESTGKQISMEITSKNVKDFNELLHSKLVKLVEQLEAAGIVNGETANQWKSSPDSLFEVQAPGKLEFTIDDQGYIREQTMELQLKTGSQTTDNSGMHQLNIQQRFNKINQAPTFELPIPDKIKSFDEVLKLITPGNR